MLISYGKTIIDIIKTAFYTFLTIVIAIAPVGFIQIWEEVFSHRTGT